MNPSKSQNSIVTVKLGMELALMKDLVEDALTSKQFVKPISPKLLAKKGKIVMEKVSVDNPELAKELEHVREPKAWVPVITHLNLI